MKYRDLARAKVDDLIARSKRQSVPATPLDPFDKYIDMIALELKNDDLIPLIEFVEEFHGLLECFFGFLYEPYPGIVDIHPLKQKSKNPRSPYFCAKLPIKGMGHVFLIPDTPPNVPFALVLKPDRPYRLSVRVDKTIIPPAEVIVLHRPYSDLMFYLTSWAVIKEASLRNIV